jgi:hypothetical protein
MGTDALMETMLSKCHARRKSGVPGNVYGLNLWHYFFEKPNKIKSYGNL